MLALGIQIVFFILARLTESPTVERCVEVAKGMDIKKQIAPLSLVHPRKRDCDLDGTMQKTLTTKSWPGRDVAGPLNLFVWAAFLCADQRVN